MLGSVDAAFLSLFPLIWRRMALGRNGFVRGGFLTGIMEIVAFGR